VLTDKGFIQPFGALEVQSGYPRFFDKGFDLSSAEGFDQLAKDGFVTEQALVSAVVNGCCHALII